MKQLIRAECHRLFYRFEPIGIVMIGAIITILSGIFMQMFTLEEESVAELQNIMVKSLRCGGYFVVIFVILMETYIVGSYIQNKIMNYELLMGYSFEQIWVVKQLLAGGLIAVVFCFVALSGMKVEMLLKDTECLEGTGYRFFLMLLVLIRISFVAMLYLYVMRNPFLAVGSFLLVHLLILPSIADLLESVRIGKIAVYNLLSTSQIELIWSESIPKYILIIVMVGMAIEMLVAYVLARVYLGRKGRGLYV